MNARSQRTVAAGRDSGKRGTRRAWLEWHAQGFRPCRARLALAQLQEQLERAHDGAGRGLELRGVARDQRELDLDVLAQHRVELVGVTGEAQRGGVAGPR